MKNFFLNVFVLTGLVVSTSCSSDDDAGNTGGASNQLAATIDGQALTFTSVIVDENLFTYDDGSTDIELDVTATIGGDTSRIVEFGLDSGDTGANAVYYFNYTVNGVSYDFFNGFGSGDFNTVVSVNDGSRLTMTFSGILVGFDNDTQEQVEITIQNGSLDVNY